MLLTKIERKKIGNKKKEKKKKKRKKRKRKNSIIIGKKRKKQTPFLFFRKVEKGIWFFLSLHLYL
jgi:hypothetical protein